MTGFLGEVWDFGFRFVGYKSPISKPLNLTQYYRGLSFSFGQAESPRDVPNATVQSNKFNSETGSL